MRRAIAMSRALRGPPTSGGQMRSSVIPRGLRKLVLPGIK